MPDIRSGTISRSTLAVLSATSGGRYSAKVRGLALTRARNGTNISPASMLSISGRTMIHTASRASPDTPRSRACCSSSARRALTVR